MDLTSLGDLRCVHPIAQEATKMLREEGIHVELIDAQTLLPFDRFGKIKESLAKTNALTCMDEDVPGGASAYMLQQIVEDQRGYEALRRRAAHPCR
jgi:pyruvate/2-oxoglutarate/acetoin dehydrogenase E1 component